MGLKSEKTNLIGSIITNTNFVLATKSKKDVTSPKSGGKSGSASKSGAGKNKKKTANTNVVVTADSAVKVQNDMQDVKLIEIDKMMEMPKFRYIPDKATMQRLIMRYISFKDDFKGFKDLTATIQKSTLDAIL
jgi:hypothetical protein